MNFRITLAYDGTDFSGWQMQAGSRTIQGLLTDALTSIDGGHVTVFGAGRTDSGVHAEGQVASFRLRRPRRSDQLLNALNGNLPLDIRVLEASEVSEEFHARRDARSKTYRYQLVTSQVMNPLLERFAWHYPYPIDLERLLKDGESLLGRHDFSAFTVASCETLSNVRTLTAFEARAEGQLLQLIFTGEGFLRYMVRTIVATLLDANRGRMMAESLDKLLFSGKRQLAGAMAPAKGLTMVKVEY